MRGAVPWSSYWWWSCGCGRRCLGGEPRHGRAPDRAAVTWTGAALTKNWRHEAVNATGGVVVVVLVVVVWLWSSLSWWCAVLLPKRRHKNYHG